MIAGPRSNPPVGAMFENPIWDADRTVAGSIIGGLVYRGNRFADLAGRYIFADYIQQRVFAMTLPATGPVQVVTLATEEYSPVGFGADPSNGDILIASIGTGLIRRLVVDTTPPPTTPPPTTPPMTPMPTPKPPSGGGGGGAVSIWFLAGLGLLGLRRLRGADRADGLVCMRGRVGHYPGNKTLAPRGSGRIHAPSVFCSGGGIGRHAGLRSLCLTAWGFESPLEHHFNK